MKENNPSIGSKFIFKNQTIGQSNDDHFFPRILQTNSLLIQVDPIPTSLRWRFGIRFSQDGQFPQARYDVTHPLFHLTKEQNIKSLLFNVYDSGNDTNGTILSQYNNETIWLSISNKKGKIEITILDKDKNELYKHELVSYRFVQLFAWADGQMPFEIESLIQT